jgi:RHS repeat-associated protein
VAAGLAQVLATSDGTLDLYGVGRIAEERGGEWAYALPDHRGSVRQWADDAGDVTYAGGYTPYGVELWQAGSTESAWGFTGEWWDADLGLMYLRARWLNPYLNQFVSPDPIVPDFRNPQSINRYVYVLGNPISSVDPSGKIPTRPPGVCEEPTTNPRGRPEWLVTDWQLRSLQVDPLRIQVLASVWVYCGGFCATAIRHRSSQGFPVKSTT